MRISIRTQGVLSSRQPQSALRGDRFPEITVRNNFLFIDLPVLSALDMMLFGLGNLFYGTYAIILCVHASS